MPENPTFSKKKGRNQRFLKIMVQNKSLREGKSRPGGAKMFPGGAATPPHFPRLCEHNYYSLLASTIASPEYNHYSASNHNFASFIIKYKIGFYIVYWENCKSIFMWHF